MKWSANASVQIVVVGKDRCMIDDPWLRRCFSKASRYVENIANGVDPGIIRAELTDIRCANMLETATGKSCFPPKKYWSVSEVQGLFDNQCWDFPVEKEQLPYYWSALKFLEVCIKEKLSIRFTW